MRRFVTYTLHQIFLRVMESRRFRWAVHVALMGKMRSAYSIFVGKPERKKHSECICIIGKIM
jgi:hypothetical protein